MMRQYIGARYVPKIYKNSQNPSSMEWENTEYEPFVIVEWLNNTYISRDQVPVNAGNPTQATSHWALFGYSSGQIAHLQEEIDDLTSDINQLARNPWTIASMSDKTVILIGDSWAAKPSFSTNSWTSLIRPYFKKVYERSAGGYSFDKPDASYITLLNNITVQTGDHIDAIIAIGGANGVNTGDVTNFINACKTAYPDAEIIVGCNGPCKAFSAYYKRERLVENEASRANVKCISKLWQTTMRSPVSNWHTDFYHLIDYTQFTANLVSFLTSGAYGYCYSLTGIPSYEPESLESIMSEYFRDGGSRGFTRTPDGDFMFYFTFTKGTHFAAASDSITIVEGTFYDAVKFADMPCIVPFYDNSRPSAELLNKGHVVFDNDYITALLLPVEGDSLSPYCKLTIRARRSGTFTKATLFPDSQIQFITRGKQFDFKGMTNTFIDNSIIFSSDNI